MKPNELAQEALPKLLLNRIRTLEARIRDDSEVRDLLMGRLALAVAPVKPGQYGRLRNGKGDRVRVEEVSLKSTPEGLSPEEVAWCSSTKVRGITKAGKLSRAGVSVHRWDGLVLDPDQTPVPEAKP